MKLMTIKIETCSDTLIGSGEGWGSSIDSDIIFDDCGLPYIPAKRIKGCLRESAMEISEMFELSTIYRNMDDGIDKLFGIKTENRKSIANTRLPVEADSIIFDNLYSEEYEANVRWLKWAIEKKSETLSKEIIVSSLTSIRQQTEINENGVAKKHSLRTIRVINKGFVFVGEIALDENITQIEIDMLSLAVSNLRYIGTKRNRGFGQVSCQLSGEEKMDTIITRFMEAEKEKDESIKS